MDENLGQSKKKKNTLKPSPAGFVMAKVLIGVLWYGHTGLLSEHDVKLHSTCNSTLLINIIQIC